ncbi:MAG: rhomboid family intramembrane serine protease [Bacteroidetes bacterium]|nr:rhomboid family intramembrane serine protease [Bacteroidota bacterium]
MIFPIGDDNIERGHPALFSYALIVLNVCVFLFQQSLPQGLQAVFVEQYGAVPAEISVGHDLQTLFTSMFLHGSWMHLLGNMLYLWIFADNIEATIGNRRFLLFYFLGGLAAGLMQVFIAPYSEVPCVGASGAIAAVMGAYIVMFPKSRIRMLLLLFFVVFYVPSWVFLGIWFMEQLLSGFQALGMHTHDAGGVAWWAHIGGFAFGLFSGRFFKRQFLARRNADSEFYL